MKQKNIEMTFHSSRSNFVNFNIIICLIKSNLAKNLLRWESNSLSIVCMIIILTTALCPTELYFKSLNLIWDSSKIQFPNDFISLSLSIYIYIYTCVCVCVLCVCVCVCVCINTCVYIHSINN